MTQAQQKPFRYETHYKVYQLTEHPDNCPDKDCGRPLRAQDNRKSGFHQGSGRWKKICDGRDGCGEFLYDLV